MKKRILAILIMVTVLVAASVSLSFAASGKTVKMTSYDDVVKVNNTAYCSIGNAVYKVNLNTGKASKLKKVYGFGPTDMRYYKGYLYFISGCTDNGEIAYGWRLYRLNVKTKKLQKLYTVHGCYPEPEYMGYAISGNKIYLQWKKIVNSDGDLKTIRKSMKLNGKSVKNSKVKVNTTIKHTNNKSYKLIVDDSEYDEEEDCGWIYYSLKTPGKRLYLGKYYEAY